MEGSGGGRDGLGACGGVDEGEGLGGSGWVGAMGSEVVSTSWSR